MVETMFLEKEKADENQAETFRLQAELAKAEARTEVFWKIEKEQTETPRKMLSFENQASINKLHNIRPGGKLKNDKTYYQIPLDNEVFSIQPLPQLTFYDAPSHYQNKRCEINITMQRWEILTKQRCSTDC